MWRKVLAVVLAAGGSFLLTALLSAVDKGRDDLPVGVYLVSVVIVGLVPAAMLFASWVLLRRANRLREPTLSWTPTHHEWLEQRFWRELPDLLPERPRRRERPMPAIGVPPDEQLRRLWSARAELAHDGRRHLGWMSITGWLGMLALGPVAIFTLLTVIITLEDFRTDDKLGAELLLMDWGACVLVASWQACVRPLRRHVALVRVEQDLTKQLRDRPDTGRRLPVPARFSLVTDPRTGYQGFYHPQLMQVKERVF